MAPHIIIEDRPCGTGKTTDLINSLRPDGRYLIVTPLLSEVERIIKNAPEGVVIEQPEAIGKTKLQDIRDLLIVGASIATTHALYVHLEPLVREGLLANYEIIIDEVPTPLEPTTGISKADFSDILLANEWVTVEDLTGQVRPTFKWHLAVDAGATGLFPKVYEEAKKGALFTHDGNLFVLAIPTQLLLAGKSLRILTYLSEGSLIRAYLDKLAQADDRASYVVHRYPGEAEWRASVRDLVTIESIGLPEGIRLSYTGQTEKGAKMEAASRRVGKCLNNLFRGRWKGVSKHNVILTCAMCNWFADTRRSFAGRWSIGSGLMGTSKKQGKLQGEDRQIPEGKWTVQRGVHWLANTTRGTNDYAHCSHAIYLFDQNVHPTQAAFLGRTDRAFNDAYALTELVQWLFRSRLRKGQPITVVIPSERMRNLLANWLVSGDVSAERRQGLPENLYVKPEMRKVRPRRATKKAIALA